MSMSVSFHVDEKTEVEVYNIGNEVHDVIKIRNPYEKEVVIFANEEMIGELYQALRKHIKAQVKSGRYE